MRAWCTDGARGQDHSADAITAKITTPRFATCIAFPIADGHVVVNSSSEVRDASANSLLTGKPIIPACSFGVIHRRRYGDQSKVPQRRMTGTSPRDRTPCKGWALTKVEDTPLVQASVDAVFC